LDNFLNKFDFFLNSKKKIASGPMNVSLRIRFLLFLKFKRINELHKILFTINIGRGFGRWKFE